MNHRNVSEFTIDSRDERLHLIAIEYEPLYNSITPYRFRVDSQVEEVVVSDILSSKFEITLTPLPQNLTKTGGCLEGMYFALDRDVESDLNFVNVAKKIAHENKAAAKLQIHRGATCGIFDRNVWHQSSSPLGYVTEYDPYGEKQGLGQEQTEGTLFACELIDATMFRQFPVDFDCVGDLRFGDHSLFCGCICIE